MSRISGFLRRRVAYPILRRIAPERTTRHNGFQMRVNLRDRIISTRLWRDGRYEPEVLAFIGRMDLTGKVCVDVGANIGLHSLAMSRQAAQVFAFEPEAYNFRLLSENIALNDLKNITAIKCALGDAEGESFISLNPANFGDHRISEKGQKVLVTTGDVVLKDTSDDSIALIKIDVQGYECRVLRGMSQTLARNPDAALLLEIFPEALKQAGDSATILIELLRGLGFEGYEFHPHRIVPLLDASMYETIHARKDVNVALSRTPDKLKALLSPQ